MANQDEFGILELKKVNLQHLNWNSNSNKWFNVFVNGIL